MKLFKIIKAIGAGLVREVVPGGGLLIDAINAAVPGADLPPTATGTDIQNAVNTLPPDERAAIMNREFDVTVTRIKEMNSTLRQMLAVDAKMPHTTRPYIARGAFHLTAFVSIVAFSMWAYAVAIADERLITALTSGWPFVLSVTAPSSTLLLAYFGVLRDESRQRLEAAGGNVGARGLAGILQTIIRR